VVNSRLLQVLLLLGLGLGLPAAEVRFSLRSAVLADTLFRAELVVENASSESVDLALPVVEGLRWEDYKRTGVKQSIVNGRSLSRSETWTILGMLDQRAAWQIPPIGIEFAAGSSVHSEPITLQATQADERLRGEYFCEVGFEPATVVPGQATDLVYDVFIRDPQGIDFEDGISVKLPEGAIPLGEVQRDTQEQVFDSMNDDWTRTRFRWSFTMSEPGSYEIGGQQGFKRVVQNRFGTAIGWRSAATVPIRPGTLTVLSLPSEGRPDDFAGLIGPVTIDATLERESIALGEGTSLSVTVRGQQIDLLGKLPPPEIPGLSARLAEHKELEDGARRYRYTLIPEHTGRFTITVPPLGYFDPERRSYRRATGPELALEVVPGRQRSLNIAGRLADSDNGSPREASGPTLPAPLRGSGRVLPPLLWGWLLLGFGAACGLLVGLGQRWWRRQARRPRLGDQLAAALRRNDANALDRLLHLALVGVDDPALRDEVHRAITAVERARFGAMALDDTVRDQVDALRSRL
jgi:hypothetical protein